MCLHVKKQPEMILAIVSQASRQKLVNARYCERFAHVRWKDGEVAHVHVTPEVERSYSRSVTVATHAMQQRSAEGHLTPQNIDPRLVVTRDLK